MKVKDFIWTNRGPQCWETTHVSFYGYVKEVHCPNCKHPIDRKIFQEDCLSNPDHNYYYGTHNESGISCGVLLRLHY
jgi:hypothetical protein